MKKKTKYNSSVEFNKSMIQILNNLLGEKIIDFLDYCVNTNNSEPIKKLIKLLDNNKFN